jgi:uncharacterized protein (TIGR02145 family)
MKKILVSLLIFMQYAAYAQVVGTPQIFIPFPHPTSNGTAIVTAYSCSTAYGGALLVGTPVSGVTQTVTATVTTAGTYSISTTANGVTFDGSGTFAGTGNQNIVLTATGTPTAEGSNNSALNTTPNCSFSRNGFVTVTGFYANVDGITKDFMPYNLGVTGTQDPLSYQRSLNNGTLYQWGRTTDGHQVRYYAPEAGPISSPFTSTKFITNSTNPFDWRTPQSNTLWGDGTTGANPAKAANDPCPALFKVPSQAQWSGLFRNGKTYGAPSTATQNTWTWTGNGYTIGSNLYLPAAGYRESLYAATNSSGYQGQYWSSTVNGTNAYYLSFDSGNVNPGFSQTRGYGFSVRCISE